jgi:microcystin-dependent protein
MPSSPYLGQIMMIAFNFAPKGWALCNGQLLPINQNTALFSLLGTSYGGNGQSTFALPNFQGITPINTGQGTNLTNRERGDTGGSQNVTLLQSELPSHTHAINVIPTGTRAANNPNNLYFAKSSTAAYRPASQLVNMSGNSLSSVGGGLPHNNMGPYLTVYFVIALQGVFPQRS